MTTAYLAARYSRHPEMREYAAQLKAIGIEVEAEWITGAHETHDNTDNHELLARFAYKDICDIQDADIFITFTESPDSDRPNAGRGGRHWETGYAYATDVPIYVVGYRENVFHYLPNVQFFPAWEECYAELELF